MPEKTGKLQEKKIRSEKGQFVPGVSGNPDGRPLGARNFTTKIREALEKIGEGNKTSYEDALVKKVLHKAIIEGNEQMIKLVWNYLDGMPKQNVDNNIIGDLKISWE